MRCAQPLGVDAAVEQLRAYRFCITLSLAVDVGRRNIDVVQRAERWPPHLLSV